MKPIRAALACACIPSAAMALLFAVGCQSKVETNPVFKAQVERLDHTEKDVDAISRQLAVMDTELQQVSLNMASLAKKASGGDPQMVASIGERLDKLEAMLKTSSDLAVALDGRLAKLEKNSGGALVASASPFAESKVSSAKEGEGAKTSLVIRRTEKGATPAARIPTAASSAVQVSASPASGVYHQVGLGETIDQIAKAYKVSPATIQQANRLPPGRPLVAGQPLFVPRR